ncbi:MAG: ATP synthase F1 subunit delta [Ignavibacteriales bacterium]|nr:ATP synthase F1 subunit delta [Ignavibacteriales bacterium]
MSNLRVANRYASALMALTNEQKKPAAIAEDLQTVLTTVDGSRELKNVLASPIISKDKKREILRSVFKKKVGELVAGYIDIMVVKGRESILHDILKQYFVLRDEELGLVRVQVKTSAEFSSKQEKDLQKQLEVMTKKKVEITFSVDKSIKGGFIARVGDTVLDGSVKRQLEILKLKLKEGSFNN